MKVCPQCSLKYGDDDARCFVDGTPLVPVADPNLGRTLSGRYLVEEKLGEGGMATVYRARHLLVDRPVAVKILLPTVASNPSIKERFRREAKNMAAIAHPNVVEVHEHGETEDGLPYLVMELLRGHPLGTRIAAGPIPADEVAAIGLQIARGLARAHDFGVIHRDLKPDNVFISDTDSRQVVKLLDFGIARSTHDSRLTEAGELFGTPQYMAPERLTSIDAGPSSDLYALGVMLYQMLTGRLPFEAETLPALFLAHLQETPPRPATLVPGVPGPLDALVMALLEKRPEDRPVDAHAVIRELAALAPSELVSSPPPMISAPRVAPTLPPTTLERWAGRTAIFDEMVRRAYPVGPPAELGSRLADMRAALARVGSLRGEGLSMQRRLDVVESEARETRERLGYAMQRVGEGLSRAREAMRRAEADWAAAEAAARRARELAEVCTAEVADLEYQVHALRDQAGRVEAEAEGERESFETRIAACTKDMEAMQSRLLVDGQTLVEALRDAPGLGDLFDRLEDEGRS